MAEYIDRQAALEILTQYDRAHIKQKGKPILGIASMVVDIEDIPAADVRPVVRATWVRCNRGAGFKCSVCKARVSNGDVVHGNHHFCYKCGAMMEES